MLYCPGVNQQTFERTKVRSSVSSSARVLHGMGGRLQHDFLHHTQVEASLIPAEKEASLNNEVQSQLTPISKADS